MLFAALILDREPLQWAQFLPAVMLWLQNAGSVAAVGVALWLLVQVAQRARPFAIMLADAPRALVPVLSLVMTVLTLAAFGGYVVVGLLGPLGLFGARI